MNNPRDYGLSNSEVTNTPKVVEELPSTMECPHCGCKNLYLISVDIENDKLKGTGVGKGSYAGCPACPWASPMVCMAVPAGTKEEEE